MSKYRNLTLTTALITGISALPAYAEKLGLGRPALPEEVAAWSVHIMPDGRGLPEGGGNVLDGEDLWVDYCAACHGDFGEAVGNWPVIAGGANSLTHERPVKTVGSYWPYLSTTWDYVNRSMPFGAAQTLEADQVYALVAYMLYSNNIVDDDFELTHENFTDVVMPNAEGFYVDDRVEVEFPLFVVEPCMENCKDSVEITMRAAVLDVTPQETAAKDAPAAAPAMTAEVAPEPAPEPEPEVIELAAYDPALAAAGEALFRRQCGSCHNIGEGARNATGPMLNGTYGAEVAHVDGFRYSPALTGARDEGMIWDAATLDAFLENPRDALPRNRMSYRGLSSADDRAAVIAYLASYAD